MNPLRTTLAQASKSNSIHVGLRPTLVPRARALALQRCTLAPKPEPMAGSMVTSTPMFARGYAAGPSGPASASGSGSGYPGGPDEQQKRARDQAAVGPFTWKAAALFILTGTALYFYFESEKAALLERRRQEMITKSIGKPSIGGPFALERTDGTTFTEKDLLGKWSLIYFGFTHCPDICPEELDKMGDAIDKVERRSKEEVQPIFISVDPARDTLPQVKKYIQEFHPRMVGLRGDFEAVKRTCKVYRVYFSTPPDASATEDYLVDHSIFFYLMDPLGQFVDAFGKATTADQVSQKVLEAMSKWEAAGGNAAAGV